MPIYKFELKVEAGEKREMAIALLTSLPLLGFEESDESLIAYSKSDLEEDEFNALLQIISLSVSKSFVDEVNWNAEWESSFQPISVKAADENKIFAYVRAHFHPPEKHAEFDLIITPKMSFGTGHHATTYGMMRQMSRINFKGTHVVDFGTGTGVLAILAEKMGADNVFAIDYDPLCLQNANENILVNQCQKIELKESAIFESTMQPDVVLANINLNIIKDNLKAIKAVCKKDTIILFSGILVRDEADIVKAILAAGFSNVHTVDREGWLIVEVTNS